MGPGSAFEAHICSRVGGLPLGRKIHQQVSCKILHTIRVLPILQERSPILLL